MDGCRRFYQVFGENTFLFLPTGIGNKEKGITSSLHTPTSDIDEDALAVSTGLMAYVPIKQLGN